MRNTLITAASLAALTTVALAGDTFEIDWYTVDGGGETFSTGGQFAIGGTIGQADAVQSLFGSGGTLRVDGGFWAVPPEYCFGDADGDRDVDFADLEILLDLWGTGDPSADFNGTGRIDFADLNILLDNWGNSCD
ncbi:MAG: hypothetical protein KDA21_09045 [Phycisphaerales bacterium]|nr:hypothetical protein [Phycisphaerales bacterium]